MRLVACPAVCSVCFRHFYACLWRTPRLRTSLLARAPPWLLPRLRDLLCRLARLPLAAPFSLMFWEREKLSFLPLLLDPGNFLLSQAVPSSVPSAFGGLTSVFGMGTGGALQLSSPETFLRGALPRFSSASLRSLRFRSASSPLGSLPLPAPSKLHRSELTSKLSLFFVSRSRSLALPPLPRPSRSLPLALPQIKPSTD